MRRTSLWVLAGAMCLLLGFASHGQAQTAAPDSPAATSGATTSAQAVVPRLVRFGGTMRDMTGKPISGTAEVTFALYAVESGGDPLWFEAQSVTADEQGRYSVLLGAMHTDGLPVELFTSGEARWLGVQVGNEAEQKPRVLLLSVPYALKAADAETLGGMPASAFVQTGAGPASGISGATAQGGTSQSKSRSTPVPTGPLSSTGTQNYISMFTDNSGDTGNSVIYQNGSNIGIGTTNPLKPLHVAFDATGATPTIIAATGATNTNRRLLLGYETSANYGVIQSNEASVGYTPLALNPNGGNVGIGMGTAQPKALLQAGAWTQIPSDIVFSGGGVALQGDFFIGNNTIPKTRMYSNGGATAFASNEYYSGTIDKPQNTSLPSWRMYMYFIGGTDYFAIQRSPASSALAYADVMHINSAGNVGIANSSPTQALDVAGNMKITGAGNALIFADGTVQATAGTGSGGGTITGVTAGTDLTGGGTSGGVTLNLDTTKVPTLGAGSNTFTGSITASSFAGNGSGLTSLNASNLGSGTVPSSTLSGAYTNALTLSNASNSFTGDGTNLANVNAAKLGGLLPSAYQLAGSYAVTTGPNSFAGTQTISTGNLAISSGNLTLPQTTGSTLGVITLNGSPFLHACCNATNANVFVGGAGNFTTTGANNTAIGSGALTANIGGVSNTAVGMDALNANTSGISNTAIGFHAQLLVTSGQQNTATGHLALDNNTTGSKNTADGESALVQTDGAGVPGQGSNNVGVGLAAGNTNTTGSNNTFVGSMAGASSGTLNNASAIGANAKVGASNALVLGCSANCASGTTPPNVGIGTATPAYALEVDGTTGALVNNTTSGSGNVLVGQSAGANVFRVDYTGLGFFDGGTQTGGADFAESVAVRGKRSQYEPGDVLEIDASADRHLALSHHAYSTLVAGIYSTKPGVLATPHTMDDPEIKSAEVPLAVVGIVPCKVTTENGPIARGDLLVASSRPGYAMKGTNRGRMLGAVVGKALEPLEKGNGVIQVLVTLQ